MSGKNNVAKIFFAVVAGIALIPVSAAYGQQMSLPMNGIGNVHLLKQGQSQTQSQGLLPRLLHSVQAKQTSTLWSTYPANIRGQVFSNKEPSQAPSMGGGW